MPERALRLSRTKARLRIPSRTLLERLLTTGGRDNPADNLRDSIRANLENALNTHRGSCLSNARIGLPDLASIRLGSPSSESDLGTAVKDTIMEAEPRLEILHVYDPERQYPGRSPVEARNAWTFLVDARLRDKARQSVVLRARIDPPFRVRVE